MDYPYQIVAFTHQQPKQYQFVYLKSPEGWLPQLTLKRRFGLEQIDEAELIKQLKTLASYTQHFTVETGSQTKPAHMPSKVVIVKPTLELLKLHQKLFDLCASLGHSKYPEREAENYFPHITTTWRDHIVTDAKDLSHQKFIVKQFWLIKDAGKDASDDSRAIARFDLL